MAAKFRVLVFFRMVYGWRDLGLSLGFSEPWFNGLKSWGLRVCSALGFKGLGFDTLGFWAF